MDAGPLMRASVHARRRALQLGDHLVHREARRTLTRWEFAEAGEEPGHGLLRRHEVEGVVDEPRLVADGVLRALQRVGAQVECERGAEGGEGLTPGLDALGVLLSE